MYVLVAGAGELGRSVARLLRSEGHDVVIIERDADAAARAQALDVLTIEGNAASPRVLEKAQVANADMLYALSSNDEVNLMACALARTRGVRTVARINSLENIDQPVTDAFKAIGAEVSVSIDMLGAIKLSRLLSAPAYANLEGLAEGRFVLAEILVPAGSPVTNLSLNEVPFTKGSSPLAFVREDALHFPTGSTVLQPGDRLLLLVRDGVPLDRVAKPILPLTGDLPQPPKRILIAGATPMGIYLTRLLSAEGAHVRLMDSDEERVRRATLEVSNALVVRGSATDRAILEEENISGFDAFVATTETEEFNILSSLIAKQLGTRRAIAVVRQRELTDLAEAMGVDAAPSPRLDGIAVLFRFAHLLKPHDLLFLSRSDSQVLEIIVREGARIVGKAARAVSLPKGAHIGGVYRSGEAFFAGEEQEIREGDHVILIAKSSAVPDIKRWF